METQRLYRSKTDSVIGGVSGGAGKYFGIDPTLIRLIFVLLTVFGGGGVLIYLILWVVIPLEGREVVTQQQTIHDNAQDLADRARELGKGFERGVDDTQPAARNSGLWFGVILILVGGMFLFQNLFHFNLGQFWPVILIAVGLLMLIPVFRKPHNNPRRPVYRWPSHTSAWIRSSDVP